MLIEVRDLIYEYNDFKLGPLSLFLGENQWISIIGRNGSGKSTFVRLLDGLMEAKGGSITIDGLPLNEDNIWKIRSKIGIVFQNPDNQFVGANVEDDVAFGLENRQISHSEMVKRVKSALKMVDMTKFAKHEPAKLSGGQKQRVAIAGILAIHPRIIILDEATSMLDPEGRRKLLKLIKDLKDEYHFTVLAITHDIDETVDADRVIVLDHGQILLDDSPQQVYKHHDELINAGLDLPFIEKLKMKLEDQGMPIFAKQNLNEEKMVMKIWQLNSKI